MCSTDDKLNSKIKRAVDNGTIKTMDINFLRQTKLIDTLAKTNKLPDCLDCNDEGVLEDGEFDNIEEIKCHCRLEDEL